MIINVCEREYATRKNLIANIPPRFISAKSDGLSESRDEMPVISGKIRTFLICRAAYRSPCNNLAIQLARYALPVAGKLSVVGSFLTATCPVVHALARAKSGLPGKGHTAGVGILRRKRSSRLSFTKAEGKDTPLNRFLRILRVAGNNAPTDPVCRFYNGGAGWLWAT